MLSVSRVSVPNLSACASADGASRRCRIVLHQVLCVSWAKLLRGGSAVVIWFGTMQVPALGTSAQHSGCYQVSQGSYFLLKYFTNSPITDDSKQTAFLPTCQRSFFCPHTPIFINLWPITLLSYSCPSQGPNTKRIPSFSYLWDLMTTSASCHLGNDWTKGAAKPSIEP